MILRNRKLKKLFFIFKGLRKKTQNRILNAKINSFKDKLESEKNSKSLWQPLRDLGMPSKKGKASSGNIGLKIDGELSFDKLKVAKIFNSFYTTVASNLVEKLPQSFNKFEKMFVESFYRNKGFFSK